MSDAIEYNGNKLEMTGSVEKITSFTSKGGGAVFTVQIPHDSAKVATLFENLQRIAKISISFSAKKDEDEEDFSGQSELDLDDLNKALD